MLQACCCWVCKCKSRGGTITSTGFAQICRFFSRCSEEFDRPPTLDPAPLYPWSPQVAISVFPFPPSRDAEWTDGRTAVEAVTLTAMGTAQNYWGSRITSFPARSLSSVSLLSETGSGDRRAPDLKTRHDSPLSCCCSSVGWWQMTGCWASVSRTRNCKPHLRDATRPCIAICYQIIGWIWMEGKMTALMLWATRKLEDDTSVNISTSVHLQLLIGGAT
jgi:hypothetical protein